MTPRPARWLPPLLLAALTGAGPGPAGGDAGTPVTLFDGKTLDGWETVNGGATFHVEDGAIVGVVDPTSKRNTFLRTEKSYGDFRLELDARLDVPGNSGIQFRSHQKAGDNGQVFGYQCEIDPLPRAWTGGIYDEGRRGWLFPLEGRPEARKAFHVEGWNHFVIEARGPHLRTWVNGVPCADLIDTADLDGFLALQVHAGKAGRIRWKNLKMTDYGTSRWERRAIATWSPSGGGLWQMGGDGFRGQSSVAEKEHGHLFGNATFADFALRLKFKPVKGDSGVYFRARPGGRSGVRGLQANIDPDKDTGGLYEIDGRGWLARPKAGDIKSWLKPGEWNEMSIVALGDRFVVHVNGHKTAEVRDAISPKQGQVALQVHAGQDVDVTFRDIEVLPLGGVTVP